MKALQEALSSDKTCLLDVSANSMDSLISIVVDHLVDSGQLPADQRDPVAEAYLAREHVVSTAIGHSVAVPHCYLDALAEPLIVFVRLDHAINLGALDGTPTRYFFFLLGPTGRAAEHLDTLSLIARLMSDDELRYDLGEADNAVALTWALERSVARSASQPERASRVAEGLLHTGRFCGGIMLDLKRRLPHYAADFRDGLHFKSVSSTLFLLFACLAPAITFGGVMAELTGNHIGAVEMILASALCGVIYALFSGQPLIILGGTGPLLVFTWVLFDMCQDLEIPFLAAYAWVGIWTALFLLILAVTDASCLLQYFTRFTDEIFASVISIVFIFTAVKALADIVIGVYEQEIQSHDAALVPLLLAMGTYYIAMSLTRFRRSHYLLSPIREFLADFGPSIALGTTIAVALFWFHDVELVTLPAPDSLRPTLDRSWLVSPLEAPVWVWFASIGPALLVTVLVYMDQNITARLVNSPDHKLTKGVAYHYDLGLIGVLIGVCSLFGLPWLVAATVRSLNHVRSLATLEEVTTPRGDSHERVIHVRETRITGLAIHLLIGMSLLLLPILHHVPMAALYGLFLFMGVVSMKGNQMFERLSLWITDTSLYPATHYIRRVPNAVIHKFTLIQVLCLAAVLVVKLSPARILFPLLIALLVPVRLLMNRYFKDEHLNALDAEEIPEEDETQW